MALSKTHLIVTLISCLKLGKEDLFKELIPYVLLPDAIRCYGIARTATHFEVSTITGKASKFIFPNKDELKQLTDENFSQYILSQEKYEQVAVGDATSLSTFAKTNAKIDNDVFNGCFIHLLQDSIYDDYIREVIDMSRRLENGEFYFNGETYDAKSVRTLIGKIEEQEFQFLQKMLMDLACIKADQNWFNTVVRPALEKAYPEKMVDCTMKYITIQDTEAEKLISDEKVEMICNNMINACIPFLRGI